jgi:hypothetical protein
LSREVHSATGRIGRGYILASREKPGGGERLEFSPKTRRSDLMAGQFGYEPLVVELK